MSKWNTARWKLVRRVGVPRVWVDAVAESIVSYPTEQVDWETLVNNATARPNELMEEYAPRKDGRVTPGPIDHAKDSLRAMEKEFNKVAAVLPSNHSFCPVKITEQMRNVAIAILEEYAMEHHGYFLDEGGH